jgi:prevent-host-death family protein
MAKTKTVNLYTAKTHLSKLVDEAAAGSEIIIAKAGRAKARLVPLEKKRPPRKPGGWEGQVWVSDDFDDELPSDTLAGFFEDDEEP